MLTLAKMAGGCQQLPVPEGQPWRIEHFSTFYKVSDKNDYVVHFRSLRDLYECACHPGGSRENEQASRDEDREGWFASKNFEESVVLAKEGWQQGAHKVREAKRRMDELLFDFRQRVKKKRLKQFHSVAGDEVDVARYLGGNPENMLDARREPVNRISKVITLPVHIGYLWNVNAENVINRGAAIAAAVELLEVAGFSVELIACVYSLSPRGSLGLTVPLKAAGKRMDTAELAWCVAHPSMFRRMIFSVWERTDKSIVDGFGYYEDNGYSQTTDFPEGMLKDMTGNENICTAFTPSLKGGAYGSIEDACQRVRDALEEHLELNTK